jgi:hypothetical protein
VIQDDHGDPHVINCEAGPTGRALRAAFDEDVLDQRISYGVDQRGILSWFRPEGGA